MSYYRGNLYTKPVIGEDGKTVVVNEIDIETTPNNKLNVKALPGEVKFTKIEESDSKFRPNFNRAYNPDYLDGDEKSTPNPDETEMYKFAIDKKGKDVENENDVKSLVSDQTRVVKGGSWKDRAYWLDPAQRRYSPEFMAADYIGFRCAMSYLGESSKKKRPRD
jgi:gliding motility-associated lipoprotein GldJ